MSYQAGDTYPATVTVRDDTGALADPTTLTLKIRDHEGTITTYLYPAAPIVRASIGEYSAAVVLTDPGMWALQWSTTAPVQTEGVQVHVSPAPIAVAFATIDDLALRLGKAEPFTAAETGQAQMLLELVTGLIVDACDRDDTWAATYTPVRRELRAVCLEAVARVMQNPTGARNESETLGQWSHQSSYTDGAHGLTLTDNEVLLCRRAVIGTTSASATLRALLPRRTTDDPAVDIYDWLDPVYPAPWLSE